MFSAGSMREEIVIQAQVRTEDGAGGFATEWTDYWPTWAAVNQLAGSDPYFHGRVEDVRVCDFVFRWRDDREVTIRHRIRWGSRTFKPVDIRNEMERDRYIVARAEENTAQ